MLVKHINSNRFDIFFNDGWEHWARFQVANNQLKQVAGVEVPKNIHGFLTKRYCK